MQGAGRHARWLGARRLGIAAVAAVALPSAAAIGLAACVVPGDFDDFRVQGEIRNEDEFVEELADFLCFRLVDCESKLGLGALIQAVCHPGVREELGAELLLREHPLGAGPRAEFDLEQARLCLDALARLPRCVFPAQVVPPACREVYTGTVQPGERCTADSECAEGRCEFVSQRCPEGICVMRRGEGQSCGANLDCRVNLVCRAGACQPPGGDGEPCDPADALADCGSELWCDPDTSRCEPLPDRSESCETSWGGDPCRGALVCTLGTCEERGEEGDGCGTARPCAPGFRCVEGSCVELVVPPETGCASRDNCPLFHECDGTECIPLPMEGETCSPLMPCIEGACSAEGTCQRLPADEPCEAGVDLGMCQGWCDAFGSGTCQPAKREGEGCATEGECGEGLVCVDLGSGGECATCDAALEG